MNSIWVVTEWYCGDFRGVLLFDTEEAAEDCAAHVLRKGDGEELVEIQQQELLGAWE